MKTFSQIRESSMPAGKHVFDKKIDGVKVMIHKNRGMFDTFIDGDKLDSYKTQQEAERMAREFIKQYKG